jgi:hypothetical protein
MVTSLTQMPLGQYALLKPPHGLWDLLAVPEGGCWYAVRRTAPSFILHGTDVQEVEEEAGHIVSAFLERMHRYGFR